MRYRAFFPLLVLTCALLLASCGGPDESGADVLAKLHGDWTLDLDASIAADSALRDAAGGSRAERGLARTMLGEMTFSIDVKNSTLSGSMIGTPLPLRAFEVVSTHGNEAEIATEGSILRFVVQDEGMRLYAANGDVLIFKRR